jgi:type I restriction enzyme S subunit
MRRRHWVFNPALWCVGSGTGYLRCLSACDISCQICNRKVLALFDRLNCMSELDFSSPYPFDVVVLPKTWTTASIQELNVEVRHGFASGRHSPDPDSGVPHLRPMNVSTEGKLVFDKLLFVPDSNAVRAKRGDIIFNNTNSAELVGKTASLDSNEEFAFSNHMTRLRTPTGLSHRFVAYQLHYLWETGYFKYRSTQHVNQASISGATLTQTIPVVVAPQLEQIRIVAEIDSLLDRYQAVGSALSRARIMLEEYRGKVLAAAVSGTLLPPYPDGTESTTSSQAIFHGVEDDHLFVNAPLTAPVLTPDEPSIPTSWRWARIDAVGELKLGKMRSPANERGEYMRPHLRVANVFEDRIDFTDINYLNFSPEEFEIYKLQAGDILLNEGQSPELVGRPAMFLGQPEDMCFQNTLIRFRTRSGISPGFALLVFRYYFRSGRFTKVARWTTNLAHLGFGRFAAMPFPVPPLAEQERIVAEAHQRLNSADEIEETFVRLTKHLASARQATLHQAFTGALIPQNADDEPASVLLAALQTQQHIQRIEAANKKLQLKLSKQISSRKSLKNTVVPIQMAPRRLLIDILAENGEPMTPEELFDASGFTEEEVELFYDELRSAKHHKTIVEVRTVTKRLLALTETL